MSTLYTSFLNIHQHPSTFLANITPIKAPKHETCRSTSFRASAQQQYQYSNDKNFPVKISPVHLSTQYNQMLEDLRQLIKQKGKEDRMESLKMVDVIKRVGFENYYTEEINRILNRHYEEFENGIYKYTSVHDVSLSFRLLRHHGYNLSADVFNDFKGSNGQFREELRWDVNGLMELFEATQISFEGEIILDEAQEYSSKILHEYCLSKHAKSRNIQTRLTHPYHKSIAQLMQRDALKHNEGKIHKWEKTLSAFMDIDFCVRQSLFQDELLQVSKWWHELGLTRELKRARNQPLKCYTWSMAILFGDINLSNERIQLTKPTAFVYLIDDIFDVYGSLHELTLFKEAIDKWDYDAIATLPDYMKKTYRAILNMTDEINQQIYRMYGHNPINHLKQAWASLCNAFLVEAKWLASGNLPTAEEYLDNGGVTTGVPLCLVHMYFLLGLGETNESNFILNGTPTIMSNVATILRLWNDLGNPKDEDQDGKYGYYIAWYMKDSLHLSSEEVRRHVMKRISREWKCLNKECSRLYSPKTSTFLEASLNLARMVPLMYDYNDNKQLHFLEEYVNNVFFNQKSKM